MHLCDILKIVHDIKLECEILYLLSLITNRSKFIATADPEDLFKAACKMQKEFDEIFYDTIRHIEYNI